MNKIKPIILSALVLSTMGAMAQPNELPSERHWSPGSPGYHNRAENWNRNQFNFARVDRMIVQQDREINNAIRTGRINPRERQRLLNNAQMLKNQRNMLARDGRINRGEFMALERMAESNQRAIQRAYYNHR